MRTVQKGEARLATEAAMMLATKARPMTSEQIAQAAGIHITAARTHIGNTVNRGLAYNILSGHRGFALYVWGMRPDEKPENAVAARTTIGSGTYTGEPSSALREGSMSAFDIPSLGESVRRRPFLMGAKPEVRV